VADRLNVDLADVYEALAYYHRNPEESGTSKPTGSRLPKRQSSSKTPSDHTHVTETRILSSAVEGA